MVTLGLLHIVNRTHEAGEGDEEVATVQRLPFERTTAMDIILLASKAFQLSARQGLAVDQLELIPEGVGLPALAPTSSLLDACVPPGSTLLLRRAPALLEPSNEPLAVSLVASSRAPVLTASRTAPMSPQGAMPGTSSIAAPQSMDSQTLEVVVQGAKGRPVYSLAALDLYSKTIAEIKKLCVSFSDVPWELQRLFVANRMRRDDEVLGACLVSEDFSSAPVARLFRESLTVSVSFCDDGVEFQIHELLQDDTVVAVRDALRGAHTDINTAHPWFDPNTVRFATRERPSSDVLQDLTDNTLLSTLRVHNDGGVIALSAYAPASAAARDKRRAKPADQAAASSSMMNPTLAACTLDSSAKHDRKAGRNTRVMMLADEEEVVLIGSPSSPQRNTERTSETSVRSTITLTSASIGAASARRRAERATRTAVSAEIAKQLGKLELELAESCRRVETLTTAAMDSVARSHTHHEAGRSLAAKAPLSHAKSERSAMVSISPDRAPPREALRIDTKRIVDAIKRARDQGSVVSASQIEFTTLSAAAALPRSRADSNLVSIPTVIDFR